MKKTITLLTILLLVVFMVGCENSVNPIAPKTQNDNDGISLAKKGGDKAIPTGAKPGFYNLVAKSGAPNWDILENPFGKAKYDVKPNLPFANSQFNFRNGMLVMNVHAMGLTPGNWYYVEMNEKTAPTWTVIGDGVADSYNMFYGQANVNGVVNINFSWDVSGHDDIEVNLKNADNVALLSPSTYGVPSEWILGTGQGWDYVLFGIALIDTDEKNNGQYLLVSKTGEPNWFVNQSLEMRIKATGLEPGWWYYVEMNEKTAPTWTVIGDGVADSYNMFYGQADVDGNVKIEFIWDVTGHNDIEVNMKTAENVALLNPSTYGVPSEWILGTGFGWDYVLYGASLITTY